MHHIICRDVDGDLPVRIHDGQPLIASPDNITMFDERADAQAEADRLTDAEEHGDRSYHVID